LRAHLLQPRQALELLGEGAVAVALGGLEHGPRLVDVGDLVALGRAVHGAVQRPQLGLDVKVLGLDIGALALARRLLLGAESLEVLLQVAHALHGRREVAVVEDDDALLDPVEQLGGHRLVLGLHARDVGHLADEVGHAAAGDVRRLLRRKVVVQRRHVGHDRALVGLVDRHVGRVQQRRDPELLLRHVKGVLEVLDLRARYQEGNGKRGRRSAAVAVVTHQQAAAAFANARGRSD